MRRIGVLSALAEDDPEAKFRVAIFQHGLPGPWAGPKAATIQIEYRWSGGDVK